MEKKCILNQSLTHSLTHQLIWCPRNRSACTSEKPASSIPPLRYHNPRIQHVTRLPKLFKVIKILIYRQNFRSSLTKGCTVRLPILGDPDPIWHNVTLACVKWHLHPTNHQEKIHPVTHQWWPMNDQLMNQPCSYMCSNMGTMHLWS